MKNKIPISGLALAAMLLCGGCYPYHFTKEPGVKGRAVDARTHAPLAGVKVELTGKGIYRKYGFAPKSAMTGADGKFLIRPEQYWSIVLALPYDPMRWVMQVQADAKGFQPGVRTFEATFFGPGMTDLGEMPLKKK